MFVRELYGMRVAIAREQARGGDNDAHAVDFVSRAFQLQSSTLRTGAACASTLGPATAGKPVGAIIYVAEPGAQLPIRAH
jgi:hypothetical protein